MNILITTQAVDNKDDHFVFFLDWISEFAASYKKVTVIALRTGEYTLPPNVKVVSLGKNEGKGRLTYLYRFFKTILSERREYDDVFVFMNPEYVVLGGLIWRYLGKRIGLWYTHKQVNLKLRVAHFFTHIVFTAIKESFRIPSTKVCVVGHGINTDLFSPMPAPQQGIEILTVSRIAPIKHIENMIEAVPFIEKKLNQKVTLSIVSALPSKDDAYYQKLITLITQKKLTEQVHFLGAIPGGELPPVYNRATITFNLTPTGGLDKAVLESLSCGVPVIASNQGLRPLFGVYQDRLSVALGDVEELAEKASLAVSLKEHESEALRALVKDTYSYKTLIKKIIAIYETGR